MRERIIGFVSLLIPLFVAGPAAGQPGSQDKVREAKALYDTALEELDGRQYESACPKLETVTRLLPEALGAKLTLASCYEGWGRLASAWAEYNRAAELAAATKQDERERKALRSAAALGPRLARLRVVIPSSMVATPGFEVRIDGALVTSKEGIVNLPLDAGSHVLEFAAPGFDRERRAVVMKDGEETRVEGVHLSPAFAPPPVSPPKPSGSGPATGPGPVTGPGPAVVKSEKDSGAEGRGAWAWAVGGVGIAALGVGIGFVVDWADAQGELEARCPGRTCELGEDSLASLTSMGDRWNRSLGVGVGLGTLGLGCVVAASVALVSSKRRSDASMLVPIAGPQMGGVVWRGLF
ncbi:hypothetical protein [Polyangium jinanense]|uniref:PEGA domain-containing protein n=1 Tax=Polyangium jinanense TaxID=2829994 RepID=A0A9X3XH57_9BACT|nr:hypothetical protein [Polyangium jinanense]MDC3961552.1 hypothetical protein [Polyangium jinanense]MDC3987916.1 hypothetical protein [Polyangium jinanense]